MSAETKGSMESAKVHTAFLDLAPLSPIQLIATRYICLAGCAHATFVTQHPIYLLVRKPHLQVGILEALSPPLLYQKAISSTGLEDHFGIKQIHKFKTS